MADLNSTLVRGNLRVTGKMYGDSSNLSVATTTKNGIMSATDKSNLDAIYGSLFNDDQDTVVNRLKDVLSVFSEYPEGTTIVSALNGKAPTNHASANDTYGKGTTANYGHVKLSNDTLNANSSNTDGVAAGLGHKHSQYAPTNHASANDTYGKGTTANYGHVKLVSGDVKDQSYTDGVAAAAAHTHSNYLTTDGDHGNIITYPNIGGTLTSKPFLISRSGSGNSEVVQQWIDDNTYHIKYINDETASSIKWYLNNTGSEGNNTADASEHTMTLSATKNAITLKLDNTAVSMNGHTHSYNDLTDLPNIINMEMESITYASLKSKRDNSELTPGKYYRITDYTCTTTQYSTDSAGHDFDIIVLALSKNELSEEASAARHILDTDHFISFDCSIAGLSSNPITFSRYDDGDFTGYYCFKGMVYDSNPDGSDYYVYTSSINVDYSLDYAHIYTQNWAVVQSNPQFSTIGSETQIPTNIKYDDYFANSNLSAWKLWYCIDNDTSRFGWADGDNCIVVDGVICSRYPNSDFSSGTYHKCWRNMSFKNIIWYTVTDTPEIGETVANNQGGTGLISTVSSVHIGAGKGVIYRMIDEYNNDVPYDFKNIRFTKDETSTYLPSTYSGVYTFSRKVGGVYVDASVNGNSAYKVYNNKINDWKEYGKQNLNWIVFISKSTAIICHSNYFNSNCYRNTFIAPTTTISMHANTFGVLCERIELKAGNIVSNIFCNNCFNIKNIANDFSYNYINTSTNVLQTQGVLYTTFGLNCVSITINWKIRYSMFDTNCKYLTINSSDTSSTSNQLQNYYFYISGINTSPKTITLDPGLTNKTNVRAIGSTEIVV